MLPKTSAFVRSYDNETKFWFLVKDVELFKKILIIWLKLVIVLTKDKIASPST